MSTPDKQTKPLLRKIRGLWYCGLADRAVVQRLGFSPAQAYEGWKMVARHD